MTHKIQFLKKIFPVFLLLGLFWGTGTAQTPPILIDGSFSDWGNRQPIYTDPRGDANGSPIDFGRLWAGNDNRFLFLSIEVGSPIVLQNDNAISLFIDTDNNPHTGEPVDGIGAELQWTFGQRNGFYFRNGALLAIFHGNIGLVTAPSLSSDIFEMALDRTATISGQKIFSSDTIHIVFRNAGGDELPNTGSVVTYIFGQDAQPPLPVLSIRRAPKADFRVVAYNVLHDGPFDSKRGPAFGKILSTLHPDLIGFEEIYEHSADEVAQLLNQLLPLPSGQSWHAAKVNPDVLAVSRFPILKTVALDGNGAFLLDLRSIGKNKLLFIVAHPPCCNKDEKRQREIDHIMAFVRDVKSGTGQVTVPRGTPILIAGDMNLVGDARQLHTFLSGDIVNTGLYGTPFHPDWDGTDLADLKPRHPNWPMAFTWFNPHSSYSPGRLDYMIFTDSVLKPLRDFVLFTPEMAPDSLRAFYLNKNETTLASDHLPVICDFSVEKSTRVGNRAQLIPPRAFSLLPVFPNPFNPDTTIRIFVPKPERVNLSIWSATGHKVRSLADGFLAAGTHTFRWNGRDERGKLVASGVYFCLAATRSARRIQKITLLR